MDKVLVLTMPVIVAVLLGIFWKKRNPDAASQLRPVLPYVWIFLTLDMAYLCFTAHERKAWWWLPPVFCLIMTIYAFVRQRKLSRAERSAQTPSAPDASSP